MHLDLFGRPHRIYVEEAGEGTPLLCLHTAGSDGRQYRGLMNDARVTAKHRVIAFDMPWHGKSSPPAGWHEEEYQLTSAQYTTMILEIMTRARTRQADPDRLFDRRAHLPASGARTSRRFRAIIGLQAGAHVDPYYDLNFLHRPDVHGGEVAGAIVSGLVGPDAPDKRALGNAVALHAGRSRRLQGRSLFLQDRRRHPRPRRARSTRAAARCSCCRANTTIPARRRRRLRWRTASQAAKPPS